MACKSSLLAIAFKAVCKIGRIAYYSVKFFRWLIFGRIYVDYFNPIAPWRIIYILNSLESSNRVYFNTCDFCIAALCCHNGDKPGAGTDIQNPLAVVYIEPCAQQAAVGAHFHGTAFLLDREFFESKIIVGHSSMIN